MSMQRGILSLFERILLAWEGLTLTASSAWRSLSPLRAACARQTARTRAWPLVWSFVYVALFCVLAMLIIDRPLARLLKAHVGGDVEGFFKVITRLGEAGLYLYPAGVIWLVLLLAAWRSPSVSGRARWLHRAIAPGFLIASIAVSGLISNVIKFCVGRYRPRYLFDENVYGFNFFSHAWAKNSFPSGHSQAAFAAMTALAILFPRHAALWFTIAMLVALSRVATTVHYLSDVLAGSWLAICVAIILARQFRARGWDPRVGRP